MIIVFVIDNFNAQTNGTTVTAARFAEGLRKRGHTVRIISNDISGPDMFSVPTRYIPIVSRVSKHNDTTFAAYDQEVFKRAYEDANVVHFFVPWKMSIKGRRLAEKMGIPCTAAFHCQPENITYNIGFKNFTSFVNFIYGRFKRRFYKNFDNIHCPSAFIASQLRKHNYRAKLHVFSNGVAEYFTPKTSADLEPAAIQSGNGGKINILMVGRLAPEKRQDLIINAVNISKYRDKIQLTFAGNGPSKNHYLKLAKKLPNAPVFGFYSQEELVKLIYNTDLYVHASDVEIEAIACIEAFSCGKVPVISDSKRSATPQFALDERSLFKAGNYKDLAKKIDYWLDNGQERRTAETQYAQLGRFYNLDFSISKAEQMFSQAVSDQRCRMQLKNKAVKEIVKRTRNGFALKKVIGGFVYYVIAIPVLSIVHKLFFGLRIKNRRMLRKIRKTGAVTICNHVHTLDAAMCATALYPRKPLFPTLPSNLKMPVAGTLVNILGGVPTPANTLENKVFFYQLTKKLVRKKLVHFYPEGDLIQYSPEIREFKRGAFHLAAVAQVPILPMKLVYRHAVGFMRRLKKGKPMMTLVLGEPIYPDYRLLKKEAEALLKEQCELAMKLLTI